MTVFQKIKQFFSHLFGKLSKKAWGTVGILLLTLLLCVDLGYHLISGMQNDPETMPAKTGVLKERVTLDALTVREELPILFDGDRYLFLCEDGERVQVGTPLIRVYPDSADKAYIAALSAELTLKKTLQSASDARLDKIRDGVVLQIEGKLLAIEASKEAGSLEKTDRLEEELHALMLIRERLIGTVSLDKAIKDNADMIAVLEEALGAPRRVIASEAIGWFSSDCDGYETKLSSNELFQKGLGELIALFDTEPDSQPKAKLLLSHKSYAVAVTDAKTARDFALHSKYSVVYDGRDMQLTLEKTLLEHSSDRVALLFSSAETAKSVTLRRISPLRITLKEHEGFKIPASAIAEENGIYGVYILKGFRVEFREIAISYRDGNTALCDPAHEGSVYRALAENDHVIIKGDDLYDGKII